MIAKFRNSPILSLFVCIAAIHFYAISRHHAALQSIEFNLYRLSTHRGTSNQRLSQIHGIYNKIELLLLVKFRA